MISPALEKSTDHQEKNSPSTAKRRQAIQYERLDLNALNLGRGKTKYVGFQERIRRRSCYCSCCGGSSALEKKTLHLPQDINRKVVGIDASSLGMGVDKPTNIISQLIQQNSYTSLKSNSFNVDGT